MFPPSVTAQTRSDEVDNFYEKFNGDPESLDVGVKRRTVDLEMIKKRFEGLPKRQQRFYINRLSKVKPQKPPSLEPFKKVKKIYIPIFLNCFGLLEQSLMSNFYRSTK